MTQPNSAELRVRLRDAYPPRYVSDNELAEIAQWTLVGGLDPTTVPDPAPEHQTITHCHPLGNVVLHNALSHEEWAGDKPGEFVNGFLLRLTVEIGDAYEAEFAHA